MNWRLYSKITDDFIRQFPEYPPAVLQILFNRDLKTQKQIDEFFNSDFEGDIHDPFLLKGMKAAVEHIKSAILKQKKIIVYGDYDVDGVCGTFILKSTLNILGAQRTEIYIPDRNKEGYGLNLEAVKNLSKAGAELIITVDCGISNFEEVKLAKKMGIEVIITDHHRVLDKLPETEIIINPHQKDDNYPFKNLAGAGIAYKLSCGLLKNETKLLTQSFEKWLLDLVALATVADSMVLLGENRTLVKYGLIVLNKTQRVGLKELINQSGLSLKKIDTYEIAFVLSPRLNAAGRMDHANMAYELLLTDSPEEAKWLAQKLCQLNQERQNIVDKIVKEIEKKIGPPIGPFRSETSEAGDEKIIFSGGENWPVGILGIIAGRLCDKYHRPAVIYQNISDNQEIKGTSRSIMSFNMVEALNGCGSLLIRFGGHPQAAGFSLLKENLDDFRKCLSKKAEKLEDEDLIPVLNIDLEINSEDINWQIYEQMHLFAPFGQSNEKPVFLMRDLRIKDIRAVGNNGKHLKMELQSSDLSKIFKAIGFNLSVEMEKLKIGDTIDIVFEMLIDEWNGFRDLQLKIIDLKK